MIEKLCATYGEKLLELNGQVHYNFPTIEVLAKPEVDRKLRDLGFGYRAKFIQQSASKIVENGGRNWLLNLRTVPYQEAKTALMTLPGIGAKVSLQYFFPN
jgi:N-glycosylase/DNA lyase